MSGVGAAADRRLIFTPTQRRREPEAAPARGRGQQPPAPVAGVTPPAPCRYAAMSCAGCGDEIGLGAWCIPGGSGMVCNRAACFNKAALALARRRASEYEEVLRTEMASAGLVMAAQAAALGEQLRAAEAAAHAPEGGPRDPPPGRPAAAAASQRQVQMVEKLSEQRRLLVRRCLAGDCEHARSDEARMTCVGSCGRSLHGVACAQLAHGHAVIGCFRCPDCRLGELFEPTEGDQPEAPEGARRMAEETMLIELSAGAEGTGGGYADLTRSMEKHAEFVGAGRRLRLPVDNAEVCKMFLNWFVNEEGRARSLDSMWRTLGSFMTKTGRANLTKDSGLSALYHELSESHGIEAKPRTAATRRMARLVREVLPRSVKSALVLARTQLGLAMEVVLGLRVGETLGAGDAHGVTARNTSILRRRADGLETVEAMLEHSKTKYRRWTNGLGTTLGEAAVPLAKLLRDYWALAGFTLRTWSEGGFEITAPDYFVLRVSFLGMDKATFDRLGKVIAISQVREVRELSKAHLDKARKRYAAKSSQDKRYCNFYGGAADAPGFAILTRELCVAGFEPYLSKVEGPLLRSTIGGNRLTHMPIEPSSTYELLHTVMDECYRLANPEGDPDPELDLAGLEEPLWGHHSWRRLADTVARQTRAETGVSEADIDHVFGWREAFYSKLMQIHYESRFTRERRYRVTMML